ncbi:MAG TPA: phospho-N-acetylmuramoyl-pentapeptide-transferase [Micromonosporaceae bacterium]|nr:phospho-N-acetylmuramoyl-pentapeptide-transferase [Micromonosporaceae bacterium]
MRAVIVAMTVGFVLTLLGAPLVIAGLRRANAAQPIRDINPVAHQLKRGTPTMGGLIFIGGTIVAYTAGHLVLKTLPSNQIVPPGPTVTGLVLLGLMVCCGAIGFLDDLLKVTRRDSAGLAGRWKLLLQLLIGVAFGLIALHFPSTSGTTVADTTLSFARDLHWADIGMGAAVALFVLVVMATTNAVNLTDGLDGLATGTAVIVLLGYVLISFWQYRHWCSDTAKHLANCYTPRDPLETSLVAGAAAASCAGFLWWNTAPARVQMGDTGSMALGGLIAGEAYATRTILLLPLIGALFVIVAGSRVIQYASWKTRHKRVFRMSPLHHHFEMVGWSEVNIVIRFWIIAGIGAATALAIFYGQFISGG